MEEKPLMKREIKSHKAIAMLELIFAIVIMGITLLSMPMIVNLSTQSAYTTLQQESTAAASSNMALIISREWDEAGTTFWGNAPILEINTTVGLTPADRTNIYSRTYVGTLPPVGIGADDLDDIDDLNGADINVSSEDILDLIDNDITMSVSVDYLNDLSVGSPYIPDFSTVGGTTNIKGVSITLTTDADMPIELQKEITLKAFSCNIGSYVLKRRVFE